VDVTLGGGRDTVEQPIQEAAAPLRVRDSFSAASVMISSSM
jgi:hypothetical protein